MPAKYTSRISWKDPKKKARATKIAKKEAGSLSAHIQQLYDSFPDPE